MYVTIIVTGYDTNAMSVSFEPLFSGSPIRSRSKL